jgi:hypothetical protein
MQSFMNDLMNACVEVGMELPAKGGMPQVRARKGPCPTFLRTTNEGLKCSQRALNPTRMLLAEVRREPNAKVLLPAS